MKKSVWVVYCANEPQMEWFDCEKDAEKFCESANESGHEASEPLPILIPVIVPDEIGEVLYSLEYARDASDTGARFARIETERHALRHISMQAEKAINYVRAYRNDMWMTGELGSKSVKKGSEG